MSTEYNLSDDSYNPPIDIVKTTQNKNKVYKKKTKNSPLDDVVNEILQEKKDNNYSIIVEYSDEEYECLFNKANSLWDELAEIDKKAFDNDKQIFILIYLFSEAFIYEQKQKQVFYGASESKISGRNIYSISYTEYMSYSDRINNGYFTMSEKNRIMEKMFPLSQSIYRKYVPGDDCFVGPYNKEDIREAIYLGITKAMNSYVAFNEKTKVSFSSWAYTCMNNACIDTLKYFKSKKNNAKVESLDDTGSINNGNSDNNSEKTLGDKISTNTYGEDFNNITDNLDRKEFVEQIFTNMLFEGEEKVVKTEIIILKAYFGFLSGETQTLLNISNMLNMKLDKVKQYFSSGKERLIKTVYKMGYTKDEVVQLFFSE